MKWTPKIRAGWKKSQQDGEEEIPWEGWGLQSGQAPLLKKTMPGRRACQVKLGIPKGGEIGSCHTFMVAEAGTGGMKSPLIKEIRLSWRMLNNQIWAEPQSDRERMRRDQISWKELYVTQETWAIFCLASTARPGDEGNSQHRKSDASLGNQPPAGGDGRRETAIDWVVVEITSCHSLSQLLKSGFLPGGV